MSAIADELCQNAAGCLGMDERDLQPEQAAPGRFVDQLHPVGPQTSELGGHVCHLKAT